MGRLMASRYVPALLDYPMVLQINLDTVCNIHCFFCAYEGRTDKPVFNLANLHKLAGAIRHAKYISLSAWGDPLCSPNLPVVLSTICSLNDAPNLIAIVTNGTRLSPELAKLLTGHLGSLTVSLNAGTPATYNRDMRGTNWGKTLDAIRSFMGALRPQDRSKVGLHMVAHGLNVAEIVHLPDIALSLGIRRIGVDQFTVNKREYAYLSLIRCKPEYNAQVEVAEPYARSKGIEFAARRFGSETKTQKCLSPWIECHVWADGKVAPCDCNGTFFIGNAYQSSFESVWFGKDYARFRKHPAPQCATCPKVLRFDDPRAHVSPYMTERGLVL